MNLINTVGFRLREERAKLGITQAEFAKLAGVTHSTQSLYETNRRRPDSDYLSAIARHGIDVLYVLTGNHSIPVQSDSVNLSNNELELITLYRASPVLAQRMVMATLKESAAHNNNNNNEVGGINRNVMPGNETMHKVHSGMFR